MEDIKTEIEKAKEDMTLYMRHRDAEQIFLLIKKYHMGISEPDDVWYPEDAIKSALKEWVKA